MHFFGRKHAFWAIIAVAVGLGSTVRPGRGAKNTKKVALNYGEIPAGSFLGLDSWGCCTRQIPGVLYDSWGL